VCNLSHFHPWTVHVLPGVAYEDLSHRGLVVILKHLQTQSVHLPKENMYSSSKAPASSIRILRRCKWLEGDEEEEEGECL